ncbi:MAG TPA: molybdate ABC transporter permease subunit [Rhizomicrobium sp.]|jgi:molybdate transport system permease protein|nr:molybdate ABC transporter permease subunit [Rhizomicrobium sp.]
MLTAAESEALFLSLRVSLAAVIWVLPLALALAVLTRHAFPGRSLVEGIVHLPLALPPVVVGFLLLMTFGTREPVGAWLLAHLGIRFAFNWTGAALAAGVITFPFQYRAIRLSLQAQNPGLDEAAETLGAGPIDRFVNLTLPLALPGIVAGAITAFAASLGEFGAIITFVSSIPGETRTLPLAIYSALQQPGGEIEAARLAGLSVALALIGVMLAGFADRRMRAALGA